MDIANLICREELYENTHVPRESRDTAALVLSKVFYHLGQYDEALSFALRAEKLFQLESLKSGAEEYIETMICAYLPFA